MSTTPRILIIDDDPMLRVLLVTLLRPYYVVAVAADGREGLQKAMEHPPDVALVDIQMPGWDGVRTVQEFHTQSSLQNVKIIMVTADATAASVIAAVHAGAQDYVLKSSVSREYLREKIERILKGEARL